MAVHVHQIQPGEEPQLRGMLSLFAAAFHDSESYLQKQPRSEYLEKPLGHDYFIPLVAVVDGVMAGALVAYELKKFEQERSELYIAVAESWQRQGIASAMIHELKRIAKDRGAYVIFVQADQQIEDEPAIALYTKLGIREDVLYFDIPVDERGPGVMSRQTLLGVLAVLMAWAAVQGLAAEQIATTQDGNSIILFDDHTWRQVSETPPPVRRTY